MRHLREQSLFQTIAQCRNPRGVLYLRLAGNLRGLAQADNSWDVFGTRPKSALVMPAIKKLPQSRAATNIERANALWGIELVAGKSEQIDTKRVHIDGQLARGLHRVGVEVHIGFSGDAPDFFQRLHRAEFI